MTRSTKADPVDRAQTAGAGVELMERTEPAGAPTAAASLRYVRELHLCGSRLTYTEWALDLDDGSADRSIAEFIASAYVPPDMRWKYPDGKVGSKLPPAGSARKGDFGEIWAGTLYSQLVGRFVPFQRLEGKPAKKSTLQGGDLVAVTLAHGDNPQPVAVEVKYRTKIDGGVLTELTDSLNDVDEDYLATAWEFGVTLMNRHPEAERSFAHSAAVSLARLRTPAEPLPPHERHAVVLGPGTLTPTTIEKQWGTSPPVSHLHVIKVVGGEGTIDRLYGLAAELLYVDVASGAPALIESKEVVVGIAAPASSTSALALAAHLTAEPVGVVEAALWLLADWDGMGTARARYLAETATMPAVQGLARLLTGAAGRAREALDGNDDLLELVDAVAAAWRQKLDRTSLLAVADAIASRQSDTAIAQSIRYTGAAVAHRLARHPRSVLAAAGSGGPCVTHIVEHLSRVGIQALWPSQAKAVGSGLLDRARPCLALKMPTSAGKTLLIELLVAETLDTEPDAVVAILAPSRALVSQLSNDLRRRLGNTAEVRSSHGGMDFDLEDSSADGILSGHGVATLTPERFDLEWRRATVGDGTASIAHLKLLIVDEAHLLMEGVRGAQLELVVARALRRGIRVVVLSSQFPDVRAIASWLSGNVVVGRVGAELGGEREDLLAAGGHGSDGVVADAGDVGDAAVGGGPGEAAAVGVVLHLGFGEVACGCGVGEQAARVEGLGAAVGGGDHVGDDDVLVELGFELAVGVVAVTGGEHPAGGLVAAAAADPDGVAFEVVDRGGDAGVERFLAQRADLGAAGCPQDRQGLGGGEGDVVADDHLGLAAGVDEAVDLGAGHSPLASDLDGVEVGTGRCVRAVRATGRWRFGGLGGGGLGGEATEVGGVDADVGGGLIERELLVGGTVG
jgi:hypothetical protein